MAAQGYIGRGPGDGSVVISAKLCCWRYYN